MTRWIVYIVAIPVLILIVALAANLCDGWYGTRRDPSDNDTTMKYHAASVANIAPVIADSAHGGTGSEKERQKSWRGSQSPETPGETAWAPESAALRRQIAVHIADGAPPTVTYVSPAITYAAQPIARIYGSQWRNGRAPG